MNPDLAKLQAYPFTKLAKLLGDCTAPPELRPISLALGEPQHPVPAVISSAMQANLDGLSRYPKTAGQAELREAIAAWLCTRFSLPAETVDPDRHLLPVNGTREALFAFAQCTVDRARDAIVLIPNPFYQIYEGATLLAGATPWYVNCAPESGFLPDLEAVPPDVWRRCQLMYLCSPGNPTGAVPGQEALQRLIELADRYDFVLASDECYSEIYPSDERPPIGLLRAAAAAGRADFSRCVVFHSLSKRSSVPGLRSGFVAGDARLISSFLAYRTYHGCAMSPPAQAASIAAWRDEAHVRENRAKYREKFAAVAPRLSRSLNAQIPDGGFYLWVSTPCEDTAFARDLYRFTNVTVLPGSFLSRPAGGIDPGRGRARMAMVPTLDDCVEAAERIAKFTAAFQQDARLRAAE